MTEYQVYEEIAQTTSSELILFFVLVAIVVIPLYTMVLRDRKDRREGDAESESAKHDRHLERESQMLERERHILAVIKENTAVIAGLKVTLDNSGDATKTALERINALIGEKGKAINGVAIDLAQIRTGQTEIASKVNKILLILNKAGNI